MKYTKILLSALMSIASILALEGNSEETLPIPNPQIADAQEDQRIEEQRLEQQRQQHRQDQRRWDQQKQEQKRQDNQRRNGQRSLTIGNT